MKLFICLFLCLPVFTLSVRAQVSQVAEPDRNYIALFAGPTLPVGEFAKTGAQDEKAGCARLGAMADLVYTHPLKGSGWGLLASLRARWNPINTSALIGPFEQSYPGFTWGAGKPSWQTAAFMVGGYRAFPFMHVKGLFLETQVLLGLAEARLPAIHVTGYNNSTTSSEREAVFVNSDKAYSTAFSGAIRFGGSYRLSGRLYWFSYLDFWYTGPTFKNVTEQLIYAQGFVVPNIISPSNAAAISESTETRNYKQPMNSLSLEFGAGMRL